MANRHSRRVSLLSCLISAVGVLALFILVYFPLEFQITEVWMLTPRISPVLGALFLIFLVIFLGLFNWQRWMGRKLFWIILIILALAAGFVYNEYRQQKLAKEYLPKIYKVNYDWGIQARIVRIEGVNFGPAWKKGKVLLDGEEMLIRFWDEKLIIAEQQVPTKFANAKFYLIRSDGVMSNKVPFEIRDPSKLTF